MSLKDLGDFFQNIKMENKIKKFDSLSEKINLVDSYMKKRNLSSELKVSIYDLDLENGFSVNGGDKGWCASIIKVPVMVATLMEIEKGNLKLEDRIEVNHDYMLEKFDYTSRQPVGTKIPVLTLMNHMIAESDNEATNLLIDSMGIERFNEYMWELGMKNSAIGHLLAYGVPRFTNDVSPNADNLTTTNDMNICLRHIYDDNFSKVSPFVRAISSSVMDLTRPCYLNIGNHLLDYDIKAKIGQIYCPEDGGDFHEVGIIDNRLIVSIMLNKNKISDNLSYESVYNTINKDLGKYLN